MGLAHGELQCGQGLRVWIFLFFPLEMKAMKSKTSLANQAVSCLPANAAYRSGRQQQRRMASCLPTGSLAVSDVSNNSPGAAPWSGVWEAQPHEAYSCPGLCATLLLWLTSIQAYWKSSGERHHLLGIWFAFCVCLKHDSLCQRMLKCEMEWSLPNIGIL